ncbi:MAG: hypothetical protein R6W73_02455 [Candidatus Saliniplasma sp.]
MAGDNETKKKRDNRPIQEQTEGDRLSGEIIDTLDTIEDDYTRFKNTINDLKSNLQNFMENTSNELGRVKQKTEQKAEKELVESKVEDVEEDVDHVDERLGEVMREVGFGEKIDPSNIPPVLLESIYQKILDDIIGKLRDNLGNHEANLVIQEELENMRMRTSGSELFQYDGRDINIRNLISSIENNLISAKQIHSTFQELVQKLSEKIPNYRPRNFRAMVRAEGLEFVITKTMALMSRTDNIDNNIKEIEENVKSLKKDLREKQTELTDKINDIEERLDKTVADKFNQFDYRISGLEEKFEEMDIKDMSVGMDELIEKNRSIVERLEDMSSDYEMRMSIMEQELDELKEDIQVKKEETLDEDEKFVYYAIPDDGATSKKIKKKVGDEVEDVQSYLETLEEKGKVEVEKRGRWTVYVRCDEERSSEDIEGSEEKESIGEKGLEETGEEDDEVEGEGEVEVEGGLKEEGTKEDDAEGEGTDLAEVSDVMFDERSIEEEEEAEVEDEGGEEEEEEAEEEAVSEEVGSVEELEEEMTEKEVIVLDEIPEDGCTIHHLDKQFEDYDKSEIEDILEKLIEKDQMSVTKRNRWTIYLKQKEVE